MNPEVRMFAIRLYVGVLILGFMLSSIMIRGLDLLGGTVVVCALLFLILDMKAELRDWEMFEARISSLLEDYPG